MHAEMDYTQLVKPPTSKALKSGRIKLAPGEEVGEHVTEKREEMLIVLKGKATLVTEGKSMVIEEGRTRYISEGKKHNVKNDTDSVLEYVYVVSLFS